MLLKKDSEAMNLLKNTNKTIFTLAERLRKAEK